MLESLLEGRPDSNVFHCNVLCEPRFAHMNAMLPVNNWMRREAPIHVELHTWNQLYQAGACLAAQRFLLCMSWPHLHNAQLLHNLLLAIVLNHDCEA